MAFLLTCSLKITMSSQYQNLVSIVLDEEPDERVKDAWTTTVDTNG